MKDLTEITIDSLKERGVDLKDLVDLVIYLQGPYIEGLIRAKCEESILRVLSKREVCHAILTGIALDKVVEENKLDEPINSIIARDDKLYGIDEILPLSIVNLYGSIGLTNFGYLDRVKPGIIARLDSHSQGCNTFLDDIVAAIAASAASRLAHEKRD